MIVADSMGAIAMKTATPATSNSASAKSDATGKPVSKAPSPTQSLYTSGLIVVGAIAVLLFGSRALKDARIG
jgi:hypothetical protein